jgi:hypothetical protein
MKQLSRPRRLALSVLGTLAVISAVTVSSSAALATTTDTTPPTKPATPTLTSLSYLNATIQPSGSTDNDQLAGYSAQRLFNGVWSEWAFTNIDVNLIYLNQLTPGVTYTVAVVAFDVTGNRSVRSDSLTFTTPSRPAPMCRATVQPSGPQMYMAQVFIENLTASVVVANWTVTFTMPAAHTVNYVFATVLSRSGDVATLRPVSGNAQVVPGMTGSFGVIATRPSGSPLPSGFTLTSAATGTMACLVS